MKPIQSLIIVAAALCAAVPVYAGDMDFSGNTRPVIAVHPDKSTGIDVVYVVSDTEGVRAEYTSSQTVVWQRYSALGGGYAEEVTPVRDGDTYSIPLGKDDMGYIITDGGRPKYYWVVNYANHVCRFENLSISAEQDCGMTALDFTGTADRITYYTINGAPRTLDREIRLRYDTLVWDEGTGAYRMKEVTEEYEYLSSVIHAEAPLCDTSFELTGDFFQSGWSNPQKVSTGIYTVMAVDAHCTATQSDEGADNEQKDDGGALGGSAPADISFRAVTTDAVAFREWQFASDPEFENIDIRINQDETDYTFRDTGTVYVRFMASNAAGSCDYYSDTYEVTIGESALKCPNAFSPDASEGVNDEWKVSYKSLTDFECHIFNRWGVKMCSFTDPSQGWDGKYHGKYVPAGVYYYVIKATGADGKKYNLSGDINIIKYENVNGTGAGGSGETVTE